MGSNKGITLISLITALLLVTILTSITVTTSVNSFNQMKFEAAKSELEEVQKIVNEVAADYQVYLKEIKGTDAGTEYVDYFEARYRDYSFFYKLLANHEDEAENVINNYPEIDATSEKAFYFTTDDLVKYFGLKGISDVVVDFSTRTVYSADGIKNPRNKGYYYFTPADWGADTVINKSSPEEDLPVVTASAISNYELTYDIQLIVSPKIKTSIKEVYFYKNGRYTKVDNFRELNNEVENIIRITVKGKGRYQFMVVDELKNRYQSEADLVLE